MPAAEPSRQMFSAAAAEIFRSLRLELLPRRRRTIPPVLFLHRRDTSTGQLQVSSVHLASQPRDGWPRTIALQVSQSDAEWWAVSVELKLKVRDEDLTTDDDGVPNESAWLVVVVCSAIEQQVWWGPVQRDEEGNVVEIEPERVMPRGPVREEVLQVLGNRFCPADA